MTSLIKKYKSCNLGEVLTVKCDTIFEALYAVKNGRKIYSNPVFKWKLSTCKESEEKVDDSTAINFYKSKLGCSHLPNPKALSEPAFVYLKRAKIEILDEDKEIPKTDLNKKCKFVIYKKGKWHAVLMLDQGTMDKKEVEQLEQDFAKHVSLVEKNKLKNVKSKSEEKAIFAEFVESFLKKNSKNMERVQKYEKTIQEKLDKELKEIYLKDHADKRMKPETVFNTEKFKNWYKEQTQLFFKGGTAVVRKQQRPRNSHLGVDKRFKNRDKQQVATQELAKRKQLVEKVRKMFRANARAKRMQKLQEQRRQQAIEQEQRRQQPSVRVATEIEAEAESETEAVLNIFDDLMFYDLFERLSYTKYRDLIKEDYEINTIITLLLEGPIDIYDDIDMKRKRSESNGNIVNPSQFTRLRTGQRNENDYIMNNNKRFKLQGGAVNSQDQEQIAFKLFNDFFHDFNHAAGGRNPLGVDNRTYYLQFFGDFWKEYPGNLVSKYHVDEDTYMKKILEEIEPEYYEEFVIGSYDNLKLLNSSADADKHPVTKAIGEFRNTKLTDNTLIVIEDTHLTESLKNPAELFSQNTYTNILDPITKIKTDDGYTNKHDKLVYDSFANRYFVLEDNEKKIKEDYQEKIDDIVKNFFNSVQHSKTWVIKKFSIPFKFFNPREDNSDQSENKYYHFKIKIQFEGKEAFTFNIYGGMFTVERINELIGYVRLIEYGNSTEVNRRERDIDRRIKNTGVMEAKNRKLWNTIFRFYNELKSKGGLNTRNAIVFIQMMKALGDHAQIYEFNLLSNEYGEGNKNLLFSSMDRIIVAEAFRLKCPTFFPFGSLKAKFPDNFINTDLKLELEKSQQKILYFNPHNLGDIIYISKLLFENNIIREDINLTYNKDKNVFLKNEIELEVNEIVNVKNELILSLVPENILAELNTRIITTELNVVNKDKINNFLKIIILFNRVKTNLNNRLKNFENKDDIFIEKLKAYNKMINTIQKTYKIIGQKQSRGRITQEKINSQINRAEEILAKIRNFYRLLMENQININIYTPRGCQQIFESKELCESIYYEDFENIIINNVRTHPNYSSTFNYQIKLQRAISDIERNTNKKIEELQSQLRELQNT